MKPLNILIISPPPDVAGGVSEFINNLKSQLKNCNVFSLYVGSSVKFPSPNPLPEGEGFPYLPLPLGEGRGEGIISLIIRMFKMVINLIKILCKNSIDVVHINPSLNKKSLLRDALLLIILRLLNFKNIMIYFHGWDKNTEKKLYKIKLFAWLLGSAKRIMVLSPEFKESLIKMGVAAEKIIYTKTMFREEYIRQKKSPKNYKNILFMSRLESKKGIYELLAAFSQIAQEFPDIKLTFAGSGGEKESLELKAEQLGLGKRIIFTGYISGAEKVRLLTESGIFALPTYYPEGMPVALLEAMASGLVILTANTGGIKYIISEPENGIVLQNVTAENIANGLRKILQDHEYCKKTSEFNTDYAIKNFSPKIVTQQIEEIYHAIAA